MQEMPVQHLGQEDALEEGMATHSSIPMDRGAWRATVHRVAQSDTTEAIQHTCTHTVPEIQVVFIKVCLLSK